jgi:hypothetical protein
VAEDKEESKGVMDSFDAGVLSQVRRTYWEDVTRVALHIISGKLMAESMTKIRPDDYKPVNMKDLIDESLIMGKTFVDEVSRQEPPKHYIEKMRMAWRRD